MNLSLSHIFQEQIQTGRIIYCVILFILLIGLSIEYFDRRKHK